MAFERESLCDQVLQVQEETYLLMNMWEGTLENSSCWNYLSYRKSSGLMPEVLV